MQSTSKRWYLQGPTSSRMHQRLKEDGSIFCSFEPEPKPSHPVLTRVHLTPHLQLEIRTFILSARARCHWKGHQRLVPLCLPGITRRRVFLWLLNYLQLPCQHRQRSGASATAPNARAQPGIPYLTLHPKRASVTNTPTCLITPLPVQSLP